MVMGRKTRSCMCFLLTKMETLWILVVRTLEKTLKNSNYSFEKLIMWSNKDYGRFSEEMFHVWEGNHHITNWRQHIDRLHHQDVDWYNLVDCIVLELVGSVTLLLNAMHDVNKCEYLFLLSFNRHVICIVTKFRMFINSLFIIFFIWTEGDNVKTTLVHKLYRVRSFGITKMEDFKDTSNQCSKCFKKGGMIPCIFTLEVSTQFFYNVCIVFISKSCI